MKEIIRKEEIKMKTAIIGLAALVAGCATAGHEMPVYATAVRHPGNQRPVAAQPVEQPSEARVEPVMAEVGRTVMSTRMCRNSEPVVTMDEHSYTIECGNYIFVHYQHNGQTDANGNVVLEAACENMLTEISTPLFEPNVRYSQRWIDRDCNGAVDNYGAWEDRAGRPLRTTVPVEDPAQQGRTDSYTSLIERMNIQQMQENWESLYSRM